MWQLVDFFFSSCLSWFSVAGLPGTQSTCRWPFLLHWLGFLLLLPQELLPWGEGTRHLPSFLPSQPETSLQRGLQASCAARKSSLTLSVPRCTRRVALWLHFCWVLALLSHTELHQAPCQLLFRPWLSGSKERCTQPLPAAQVEVFQPRCWVQPACRGG